MNSDKSDREVRGNIVIPYVLGVSEEIRKIAATFGLRTTFQYRHTLEKLLTIRKPVDQILMNVIHSTPCECGCEHVGDSGN